jgi:hypothetical protein
MDGRKRYEKFLKSVDWKEQRAEALDRSTGFCEYCGDVAVNVHHVKYPKKYEENNPNNLVSVCKKCHDLSHGKRSIDRIADAKIMQDIAPQGITMKYLLSEGRVYASAKSWIRALKVPEHMHVWFETGLARTALLKGKNATGKLEMEFRNTPVYRWHAVAELLRAFDRQWYSDQFKSKPRNQLKALEKFHDNYESIISWGYDLQERALNSLINPVQDQSSNLTQNDLYNAINEAVTPRINQQESIINEHDVVISEICNSTPTLREESEFITVKQAINEQGLDFTSMPYFPNSRENLSGLVGQILKKKCIETGDSITSRIDGSSDVIEVNTYTRNDIYKALKEISENKLKQQKLF